MKDKIEPTYVKLSEEGISFIREVILGELSITGPIGTKEICDIEDWLYKTEMLKYDEDGNPIEVDKALASKIERAKKLTEEFHSIWGGDYTSEDLDDLNKRLFS